MNSANNSHTNSTGEHSGNSAGNSVNEHSGNSNNTISSDKTTTFANGLIWFGAGVSIAEILTGTLIAPLGFGKGLLAILIGHVIGCALLFLSGLIGAKTGKSAMETVALSFGHNGAKLFASLNILQLVGWTAVMIFSGAAAANAIISLGGDWMWSLLIGGLITIWILVGLKHLHLINLVAMAALFVLTLILSVVIFKGNFAFIPDGSLRFGTAVELSVAMPLSWLPLISDYTRQAREPKTAAAVSAGVYFLVSCWMYIIGMGAAIFTGESAIAGIMLRAGLGIAALLIIVFSTVTTTFLDVYSAGVSSGSLSCKLKEKPFALGVCAVGTLLAVFTPVSTFEGFLYLIGSVFAPMIAVQLVHFFLFGKDSAARSVDWINLAIWFFGFVLYRLFLHVDTPIGTSLPVMLITALLCYAVHAMFRSRDKTVQGED